ncbi:MAG: site-specific DNA-methyltransferase, partial [Bacteroidales bacterium]|nr:site-specific DNA-methyltransferase [Bacteroidales bacterium]
NFLSKGIISTTEYILVYAKSPALQGLFGGKADENESQPIIKRTNKSSILYIPKMAISTKLDDGIYEKGIYGDNINPVELLDDVIVKDGSIINSFSIKAPFIWSQRMFDEQFELGAKFVINTINFQIRVFKISGDDDYKGLNSYVNGVEIKGTNEDAYEELERIFNIKKLKSSFAQWC